MAGGSRQAGRGRGSRWLSEGRQAAAVRYSPAHQALAEALLNARQSYGQSVQSARSAGTMTVQTAKAQLPAVQGAYDSARQNEEASANLANAELAKLPDSPFKALRQAEVNTQLANLLKGKASDEGRIASQQVAAREGSQFAQHEARQALQSTIGQLIAKAQALGGEEGQFAVVEANKLQHEADKIQAGENASIRQSRTSLANAALGAETARGAYSYTHGGKGSGGGKNGGLPHGYNSVDAHRQAHNTIETIRSEAWHLLYENDHSRAKVQKILEEEQPSSSGKTKKGKTVHIPAKYGYANNEQLQAALDLAEKGGLSEATVKRLHAARYSVKQLGYPVYHGSGKSKGISGEVSAGTR